MGGLLLVFSIYSSSCEEQHILRRMQFSFSFMNVGIFTHFKSGKVRVTHSRFIS